MLVFEKIVYEEYYKKCESIELDTLVEGNATIIKNKAKEWGVSEIEFIHQIKLHAPQFPQRNYYSPNFLSNHIFPILSTMLNDYCEDYKNYIKLSGMINNNKKNLKIKRCNLNGGEATINDLSDNIIAKLGVKVVEKELGEMIETKLHYLHSFRNDAIFRIGLYIDEFDYPICYMSFSKVDRADKIDALKMSLTKDICSNEVVELSRVYGCGSLPQNAISFLVSMATRQLRYMNFNYIITAVNVCLGFTGSSMLASGFVPFALRPVNYLYNDKGYYITNRYRFNSKKRSPNLMPKNILFVRETKGTGDGNRMYCKLVQIEDGQCSLVDSAIEHEISEMRLELEKIWDDKTRYHGTEFSDSRFPSKGQCGVSSLHLARKLKRQGYIAMFCEGDAIFDPKKYESITNHCWVVVKNYGNRGHDVIIDLTSDQNGYHQKIIFKTKEELKKLNIKYQSKSEKDPDDVNVEHLIQRLEYLEKGLNTIKEEK